MAPSTIGGRQQVGLPANATQAGVYCAHLARWWAQTCFLSTPRRFLLAPLYSFPRDKAPGTMAIVCSTRQAPHLASLHSL